MVTVKFPIYTIELKLAKLRIFCSLYREKISKNVIVKVKVNVNRTSYRATSVHKKDFSIWKFPLTLCVSAKHVKSFKLNWKFDELLSCI